MTRTITMIRKLKKSTGSRERRDNDNEDDVDIVVAYNDDIITPFREVKRAPKTELCTGD